MGFTTTPFVDNDINNFKKSNFLYNTDIFKDYQDPTVWGFKIMFTGINSSASGLLNDNENTPGTAAEYLNNIQDLDRLSYLKSFSNMLQKINSESPWYFQTIQGLGDAWKRDFTKPLKTGVITIGCLESVDFRLTTLIDLYRKACFDWVNRKEVVPKNLRQFDMEIYIFESRRFKWWQNDFTGQVKDAIGSAKDNAGQFKEDLISSAKTKANAALVGSVEDDFDVKKSNHICFKFRDCEFSLDSGAGGLDSATNKEPTTIEQDIIINYQYVEETNFNTLYGADGTGTEISDYLLGSLNIAAFDYTPDGGTIPEIGDVLKSTLNNLKDRAISSLANKAISKAQSLLQRALLGNVYGFSPVGIANQVQGIAGDPASIVTGGAGGSIGGGPSTKNIDPETRPGNVYGEPGPSTRNIDPETGLGNVFE